MKKGKHLSVCMASNRVVTNKSKYIYIYIYSYIFICGILDYDKDYE